MNVERLRSLMRRFSDIRIAVIGDFFLDLYFDVDPVLAEVSLETGRTAHQVRAIRPSPGAAGTVVSNLSSLGAGRIDGVGLIGDDGFGFELRRTLESLNCSTHLIFNDDEKVTPVYLKPRDIEKPGLKGEYDRYDLKNRVPTSARSEDLLLNAIRAVSYTHLTLPTN